MSPKTILASILRCVYKTRKFPDHFVNNITLKQLAANSKYAPFLKWGQLFIYHHNDI